LKPSYYSGQQQQWNKTDRSYTWSQNQYWRSKENRLRNEEAGMAQSEQVQEGQPPGYILWISSGSLLDSGVKGKAQVQWIIDSDVSEHYVKESIPICNKKYLKHPISVTIARKDKKFNVECYWRCVL
jgi:hypothetical protein